VRDVFYKFTRLSKVCVRSGTKTDIFSLKNGTSKGPEPNIDPIRDALHVQTG